MDIGMMRRVGMGVVNMLKEEMGNEGFDKLLAVYNNYEPTDSPEIVMRRSLYLQDVASKYNVNLDTMKRQIRAYIAGYDVCVPAPVNPNYAREILSIESESAVYSGCWHVPTYLPDKLNYFFDDVYKRKIKDFIIVGDYGNWDWFDEHPKLKLPNRGEMTISEFKSLSLELLGIVGQIVNGKIYILTGNHESKVLRKLAGTLSWMDILDDSSIRDRVVLSEYPKMFIKHDALPDDTPKWVMAQHFGTYSQNPVKVGENAVKGVKIPGAKGIEKHVPPHVVGSHTHGGWQGFHPNGVSRIFVLGTFADETSTSYTNTSAKGYPAWNTSYVFCKDGKWSYETI